ncbi:MAG: transglutaminase family protein [Candidatus Bathyarchaeia archaeon]
MRLTIALTVILAAFTVYLYHYRFQSLEPSMEEKAFTLGISVRYVNGGPYIWNLTEEDSTIGLFMNTTRQEVYLTNHSFSNRIFTRDSDGNHVVIVDFPRKRLQSGASLEYQVYFRIVTRPFSIPDVDERYSRSLDEIPHTLKERFLGADGPWQVEDPALIELAREIAGNETNVLSIIKSMIIWIRSYVSYQSSELPKYPNETLGDRFGDCDDQANLLITLCRIVGIPAHLQIGCIYLPNQANETNSYWDDHLVYRLMKIGWHGWAIAYIPPWGWLPIDLTYAEGVSQDPLNAIRRSALTLQRTVQYMNITNLDYVASSGDLRSFLMRYDFYIYESDEMVEETVPKMPKRESVSNPQTLVAKTISVRNPSPIPEAFNHVKAYK